MIVKNIIKENVHSQNIYTKNIQNFNITIEKMNDDFYPYRVQRNAMMWINEDGEIGEIECIFPHLIETEKVLKKRLKAKVVEGLPLLEIESEIPSQFEIFVFNGEKEFVIYLSDDDEYDCEVVSDQLSFFINEQKIVAVKAKKGE